MPSDWPKTIQVCEDENERTCRHLIRSFPENMICCKHPYMVKHFALSERQLRARWGCVLTPGWCPLLKEKREETV